MMVGTKYRMRNQFGKWRLEVKIVEMFGTDFFWIEF